MAVDERARHVLYERLTEVLGVESADTLLGYLPPVGWADVATKRDLDHLRTELHVGLDHLRTELRADLRGELNRVLLTMFVAQVAAIVALVVPLTTLR